MNQKDEALQKQFEQGNFSVESTDGQAYQKVFDALKYEPDCELPVYFADRLITLIESKEKAKEILRDNIWLAIGLISFVIALIVALALTEFKLSVGVFQFFSGYSGLALFGVAFIIFLHWLDKKIIQKTEVF